MQRIILAKELTPGITVFDGDTKKTVASIEWGEGLIGSFDRDLVKTARVMNLTFEGGETHKVHPQWPFTVA